MSRDLIPTLDRQEMRAITEHGNELIDAMRPLFDEAAATLTAVREQLGPNPNREAVMNAGPPRSPTSKNARQRNAPSRLSPGRAA